MKDAVLKGTGNSRYLKSVSDFLTLYPTYADFVGALVSGTLPIDFNGINAAGFDELGTPLNKSTLLTDATATAIGLTGDATVDGALDKLQTMKAPKASPTFTGTVTVPNAAASSNTTVAASTKWVRTYVQSLGIAQIITGTYEGDGTYGSEHPNSLTFTTAPKIIFVENVSWAWGATLAWTISSYGTVEGRFNISYDGNTVSWYSSSASLQKNASKTYTYIAIL